MHTSTKPAYTPVSNKHDFGQMEREVLQFWAKHQTFAHSLERTDASKGDYVFYDGPPFATGLPHYGHLLAGTIKDIVPRYHTMRGHRVERRFGWDCHGLPIEALAQEALGLQGAHEIVAHGIDRFNEQCRSMVQRYVDEWRHTVTRMGRWVDFDHDYKTLDRDFMESIWWVFKQIWDQGRIYRSYRIMPYSWKLSTPLSNFEAGNNYKEVQDPSVTVQLSVLECPVELPGTGPLNLLVWTTTPWTLPGNLAVGVGVDIEYACVRDRANGSRYLVAAGLQDKFFPDADTHERIATVRGASLIGCRYQPLFPFFADHPNAFCVLAGDFVSTAEGTGLVHMAPAYGEDDFRVCREADIEPIDYLDARCAFTDAVPPYAGEFCKDADAAIIRQLKQQGALFHQSTMVHSYPYCERTETPLIYRAIEAWYLRVEDIRERLVAANASVRWVPEHVGEKRFANWLKEARDWNISRNRFWGSCIPVWIAEDGSDRICVGSIAELEAYCGQRITDLHKHHIDAITFFHNGKRYRRTPEVLDCWFESGAMPLAQHHYPFAPIESLESLFPADFIAEGLDQTRGWFYTLLVLSVLLFDRAPYRNVVVNGLILAEDGKKMSKRLKNYPDPLKVVEAYGADALRLYMVHSPVVRAENLRFSELGVKHVLRHLLIPWWNAYSFLVTYANVDGWQAERLTPPRSDNDLDRWIASALASLIATVTEAMDGYDLQRAVRPFVAFIEDLTNWYIRRSRRRFWKSEDDGDKRQAYTTLHYVMVQLSKVAAPFVPFISEAIYRNLRCTDMPESVHLCAFPEPDTEARDPALEACMRHVQTVVRLGRQLRTDHDLKVRQPLARLHVACADTGRLAQVRSGEAILADELNVKTVSYASSDADLAVLRIKPDYRRLGPRFGKQMRELAAQLKTLPEADARQLADGQTISLSLGDACVALTPEDVAIERQPKPGVVVAVEGALLVAIETHLDEGLIREGLAREFVSKVQGMRKTADLEITQRIEIRYVCGDDAAQAIADHAAWIREETLALQSWRDTASTEWGTGFLTLDESLNGHACTLGIRSV